MTYTHTWHHKPRGGYGYVIPVPARVISETPRRVRIAALLRDGGEKIVSVRRDALTPNLVSEVAP